MPGGFRTRGVGKRDWRTGLGIPQAATTSAPTSIAIPSSSVSVTQKIQLTLGDGNRGVLVK